MAWFRHEDFSRLYRYISWRGSDTKILQGYTGISHGVDPTRRFYKVTPVYLMAWFRHEDFARLYRYISWLGSDTKILQGYTGISKCYDLHDSHNIKMDARIYVFMFTSEHKRKYIVIYVKFENSGSNFSSVISSILCRKWNLQVTNFNINYMLQLTH